MIKTQTVKIGSNRGLPRIWIQNKSIEEAGFTKDSTYDIVYNPVQQKITINKSEGGDRKVSGTGKRSAIIDICNSMIRDVFKDNTEVEITISQNRIVISLTKIDRKKSARISNKTMGSVFTGIGGLDEAGKRSGYEASLQ